MVQGTWCNRTREPGRAADCPGNAERCGVGPRRRRQLQRTGWQKACQADLQGRGAHAWGREQQASMANGRWQNRRVDFTLMSFLLGKRAQWSRHQNRRTPAKGATDLGKIRRTGLGTKRQCAAWVTNRQQRSFGLAGAVRGRGEANSLSNNDRWREGRARGSPRRTPHHRG